MLHRWKRITSDIVKKNPWWTYKLDTFEIPNGYKGEYHYVHTDGASMIVPVMPDGKILMVNQYRYLCDRESIEFPCGGVKTGHTYEEMARLELEEEAGYIAGKWESAGEFNPYNGVTDEICKIFIARELRFAKPRPDETEEFEITYRLPAEIDLMIRELVIWDGMTLAAWSLVRNIFIHS
jgi:ADP-ribose diphosphatase